MAVNSGNGEHGSHGEQPDAHGEGHGAQGAEHPDTARILAGLRLLHDRLDAIDQSALGRDARALQSRLPAWRRRTEGEARWQVTLCTAAAIALQIPVPDRLDMVRPPWTLLTVEGCLLVVLVVLNPHRMDRESKALRSLGLLLAALISLTNAWAATKLVFELAHGKGPSTGGALLITGGAIWLTNVFVFALWYWELDQGGPVPRALGSSQRYPDFMFVQMSVRDDPHLTSPDWKPSFIDYFYLAFTNATAFSPTDTMPMSRWAKLAMTLQAAISLLTAALVISRAVNILG
jgi:hypothetical protein